MGDGSEKELEMDTFKKNFFSIRVLLCSHRTVDEGRDHLLFNSTTSTCSRTFRSNYYLIDWWCELDLCLFTCWPDSRILLQLFDAGNRWTQTRIDYYPCITSEPTNQLCCSYKYWSEINNYKKSRSLEAPTLKYTLRWLQYK